MEAGNLQGLFNLAAARATRFRQKCEEMPQHPLQDYAAAVKGFSAPLPQRGEAPEAVISELAERAEQGLMMSTGRRFFGWVIGSSHPVGVAADWLVSAWGQNVGNLHAAPAASAAETISARWLLELLDLPLQCSAGFVTGATVANFTCLAAARAEVLCRVGWDADAKGLFGAPPISVLAGDDAHTTVFSALQFLGLGRDRVVRIETDDQGVMLPDAIAAAIAPVTGPIIVIMQAGQVNTGGFDRFRDIIPLAHAKGAWVHVDGAFGLWARVAPAYRHLTEGIEEADSWATDGHKWLQTPYDCGYAIVRNELAHRRAMTIAASYLPAAAEGERDPTHYVPELSRRARGFTTWAVIKALGREGIAEIVERNCRVAKAMADRLAGEPGIGILNDVMLNQVIVRFGTDVDGARGDHLTRATIARIQQDGVCFAGGANWRGREVMRISVCGGATSNEDGKLSAEAMIAAFRKTLKHGP